MVNSGGTSTASMPELLFDFYCFCLNGILLSGDKDFLISSFNNTRVKVIIYLMCLATIYFTSNWERVVNTMEKLRVWAERGGD